MTEQINAYNEITGTLENFGTNENSEARDEIIRAVSSDGFVKMSAISAQSIVERARQIHNSAPTSTAALGRTLCAVSMLGDMLKAQDGSVTLRINGGGPIGSIITVSDSFGNVRCWVQNPNIDPPRKPNGKLDVGAAVGTDGMLTVSRDLGLKEPYIGSTGLVSGEIADDLTVYLTESEQVPSAAALGVLVGSDRTCLAAGGYIVQLLPGAPEEIIERLEANIERTGAVTGVLVGASVDSLVSQVLEGFSPRVLARIAVEYRCYCSRERILDALASIGPTDLDDIAASDEDTIVSCQFCDTIYNFSPNEMATLAKEAAS